MRIAGIYPQKMENDPKIQHAVSEPYGMEKILAVAKQDGHEVEMFMPRKSENELVKEIREFNPEVAGFSAYTCQYQMAKRIAAELKRWNPNIINMAGNRYPTFLAENIEEPFDFFIIGEGEETFRELLNEIQHGRNYEKVKGIAFRKNGKGIATPRRERINDLDSYPDALRHPYVQSLVYKSVSIPPMSENPHYAVIEYSRGCYGACNFCDNTAVWRTNKVQVSYRSPKRVVDEMFRIQETAKPVIFYFMDLNFTADTERAMELANEMNNQGLKASWYCMSNIATADKQEKLLKEMRKAGCYKIAFGVESTSDKALEKMNKSTKGAMLKKKQTIQVLENTARIGFLNQGFYIIGFEWDTEESIKKDAAELADFPLHLLNAGIYTPIPLSAFYRKYQNMDIEKDLEKHDRNTLIFRHPNGITNKSIKKLQEEIHSWFYSTPQYRARAEALIKTRPELKRGFNDYFSYLQKNVKF